MTDPQGTNVYVRLPETVLEKLDVAAARKRLKRPGAISQAVVEWLERVERNRTESENSPSVLIPPATNVKPDTIPESERVLNHHGSRVEWHAILDEVLDSQDAEAIMANLRSFASGIEARRKVEELLQRLAASERTGISASTSDQERRFVELEDKTRAAEQLAAESLKAAEELRGTGKVDPPASKRAGRQKAGN